LFRGSFVDQTYLGLLDGEWMDRASFGH
jgi:hypothetical protein